MRKVKICGIKDPETALFAAKAGADFIGIIQAPDSKRYVELSLAVEIAQAAREGGKEVVAVYRNTRVEEIEAGCQAMGVTLVQHHGAPLELPPNYRQIYLNQAPPRFRKDQDFLLLDHPEGGKGVPLDWDHLILPPQGFSWFLAGGLNIENVQEAIEKLNPYGVDVSSGVEIGGYKSKQRIETFINKVKDNE